MTTVSPEFPFNKQRLMVCGSKMAYVDEGNGSAVLFLHGNPTSSYLWRNIIPYVAHSHRVVAPDLIGMGDSDKPDIDYRLQTHAQYLDEFIDAMNLDEIVIVAHDWGSVLGMRYARLNPGKVTAIALMEPIMPPALPAETYEAMGGQATQLFRALQTDGVGEKLIYDENFFVEQVLGKIGVVRELTESELDHYRKPFVEKAARLPTLRWPREMPVAGSPSDVAETVTANGEWFRQSTIPKLFFFAKPGALMPFELLEAVLSSTTNIQPVILDGANHFVQEDHPDEIGEALADWLVSF